MSNEEAYDYIINGLINDPSWIEGCNYAIHLLDPEKLAIFSETEARLHAACKRVAELFAGVKADAANRTPRKPRKHEELPQTEMDELIRRMTMEELRGCMAQFAQIREAADIMHRMILGNEGA